jgi:hypothetical protein
MQVMLALAGEHGMQPEFTLGDLLLHGAHNMTPDWGVTVRAAVLKVPTTRVKVLNKGDSLYEATSGYPWRMHSQFCSMLDLLT